MQSPMQASMEVWDLAVGKAGLPMEEDEDGQELGRDFSCAYSLSGNVRGRLEIQVVEYQAQCGAQLDGLAYSLSTGGGDPG